MADPSAGIDDPASRYRREGRRVWIELHLRTTRQLFDARDPSPFRERDLDDDATEYLVSAAEEIAPADELALHLSFSDEPVPHALDAETLVAAMRQHFSYEIARSRRAVRNQVRMAQGGVALALVVLALCVSAAAALEARGDSPMWRLLREGLVILGWVALWRPLENLLYDWWPHAARVRVLRRLSTAHVEVRFGP